jgi:nucleoid-associated protein YgaU
MLERPVTLLLLLSAACSRGPSAAASANTLVLELGGTNVPLQESMQRLGVQPKPARAREEAPQPAVTPPPADVPQPPPAADVLEVKLEKGQSLYELARKHLGSATRWREIAEFNHFDEARLTRLREGTVVRIPLHKD